MTVGYYFSD